MHLNDVDDAVHFALLHSAAGFLEAAELCDGPFKLAGETLAVHAQVGQRFRLDFEGACEGGARDFAVREEDGLEGRDAIEAPGDVGQGLDEIFFGGALGMVFVVEGL